MALRKMLVKFSELVFLTPLIWGDWSLLSRCFVWLTNVTGLSSPRSQFFFSIFVLVVSTGWKPVEAPPFQRNTVNLNHCVRFVFLSRAIDETDFQDEFSMIFDFR